MSCEKCEELRDRIDRLSDANDSLKEELRKEREKTSDYNSVKHQRDELQKTAKRSYDTYITNPMRGQEET